MKPIVLAIKFTTSPENTEAFKQILIGLFNQISKEPAFINTVLSQGIEKPHEILVYETWNETVGDFLRIQLPKDYRASFEQALIALNVVREPVIYLPFAQWENDK